MCKNQNDFWFLHIFSPISCYPFKLLCPYILATQFLSVWKVSIWPKKKKREKKQKTEKAAFHTQKTKHSYMYFSNFLFCNFFGCTIFMLWLRFTSGGCSSSRGGSFGTVLQDWRGAAILTLLPIILNQTNNYSISQGTAAILFEVPQARKTGQTGKTQFCQRSRHHCPPPGPSSSHFYTFFTDIFRNLCWFFLSYYPSVKGQDGFKNS